MAGQDDLRRLVAQVQDEVSRECYRLVMSDHIYLWGFRYHEETDSLRHWFISDDAPGLNARSLLKKTVIPGGAGTIGYVLRSGQPVLVGNTFEDPRGSVALQDDYIQNFSWLGVPVTDPRSYEVRAVISFYLPIFHGWNAKRRLVEEAIKGSFAAIVDRHRSEFLWHWETERLTEQRDWLATVVQIQGGTQGQLYADLLERLQDFLYNSTPHSVVFLCSQGGSLPSRTGDIGSWHIPTANDLLLDASSASKNLKNECFWCRSFSEARRTKCIFRCAPPGEEDPAAAVCPLYGRLQGLEELATNDVSEFGVGKDCQFILRLSRTGLTAAERRAAAADKLEFEYIAQLLATYGAAGRVGSVKRKVLGDLAGFLVDTLAEYMQMPFGAGEKESGKQSWELPGGQGSPGSDCDGTAAWDFPLEKSVLVAILEFAERPNDWFEAKQEEEGGPVSAAEDGRGHNALGVGPSGPCPKSVGNGDKSPGEAVDSPKQKKDLGLLADGFAADARKLRETAGRTFVALSLWQRENGCPVIVGRPEKLLQDLRRLDANVRGKQSLVEVFKQPANIRPLVHWARESQNAMQNGGTGQPAQYRPLMMATHGIDLFMGWNSNAKSVTTRIVSRTKNADEIENVLLQWGAGRREIPLSLVLNRRKAGELYWRTAGQWRIRLEEQTKQRTGETTSGTASESGLLGPRTLEPNYLFHKELFTDGGGPVKTAVGILLREERNRFSTAHLEMLKAYIDGTHGQLLAKLGHLEARRHALRSAVAAIMARNLSHIHGSHIEPGLQHKMATFRAEFELAGTTGGGE